MSGSAAAQLPTYHVPLKASFASARVPVAQPR